MWLCKQGKWTWSRVTWLCKQGKWTGVGYVVVEVG